MDKENLLAVSKALQKNELRNMDFEQAVVDAKENDFVYFDPPYHPISKTASFTSYTAGSFRDEDQRNLARIFARLSEEGCLCMLSNSHTPLILDLYQQFRIEIVQANRAINSNANDRGSIREVVVLNY